MQQIYFDFDAEPEATASQPTASEIRALLDQSKFRDLIDDFEIVSEDIIEFIPTKAFWKRWRVGKNWMIGEGCHVYSIQEFRPKLADWRCTLVLGMILTDR